MERPTIDGMAWLHEALAHICEQVPGLGYRAAYPQTGGWERDGHVRVRADRGDGTSDWHRLPIGAVNGHDTAAVIRMLMGDRAVRLADVPTMIQPVRVSAGELAASLLRESRWLDGFDGR